MPSKGRSMAENEDDKQWAEKILCYAFTFCTAEHVLNTLRLKSAKNVRLGCKCKG
jgi:hypothetical protein